MKKEILFVGPPGAGKGTQAARICERFGHIHVSTGNILRAAIEIGSELGAVAKGYIDRGELVPDEVVESLVREKLTSLNADNAFLLDGYPRNLEQAKALSTLLKEIGRPLSAVIELSVPETELVGRLLKRAEVEGRSDDTEEVIRNRMKVYEAQTVPVMNFYQELGVHHLVRGDRSVEQVSDEIARLVSES